MKQYEYTYIDSATTTQIEPASGAGRVALHYIVVGTTAAGAISVIDGYAGTTANVAVLKSNIAEGTYRFDAVMKTGLRIVTAAASKITVVWSTE
jgi:hypothetical protein